MEMMDFPKTAIEFDDRFGSEEACRAYLAQVRWPDGFCCPSCNHHSAWPIRGRGLLQCVQCGRQTSLTAGTIFHRSRKPLRLWFKAIYLFVTQKTGISARGLERQLGISYPTAWTWLHKIRRAMVRPGRDLLSGLVEVDEAYIGGAEEGVHGRETEKKALVAVAVEVTEYGAGRVRMERVDDASGSSLQPFVVRNVTKGSTVKTDGWSGYRNLRKTGRRHRKRLLRGDPKKAIKHFPHVHRAISLLKRLLLGTYQGSVSHKHLPAYLNEFEFRFNRRRANNVTLLFQRVCEFAVCTPSVGYGELLAQPVGGA